MVKWIPNAITALRFIGGPALAGWFVAGRSDAPTAFFETVFLLFTALVATDWLDGFLAWCLGAESRFGVLFDPLADKALVWPFLYIFAFQLDFLGGWTLVPLAFLALFDGYSTLRRFIQRGAAMDHVRANMFGKFKTAASYGAILSLLFATSMLAFAFERIRESGVVPDVVIQDVVFWSALGMTLGQILIVSASLLALVSILRHGLRRIQTQR